MILMDISSTLSTVLNGLALTILEDFVRPCYPNLTDASSTRISKCISFGMGLTAYVMVFPVSNVKTIFEVQNVSLNSLIKLKYLYSFKDCN